MRLWPWKKHGTSSEPGCSSVGVALTGAWMTAYPGSEHGSAAMQLPTPREREMERAVGNAMAALRREAAAIHGSIGQEPPSPITPEFSWANGRASGLTTAAGRLQDVLNSFGHVSGPEAKP